MVTLIISHNCLVQMFPTATPGETIFPMHACIENHTEQLVQGLRVTCLFIGQYNTKGYDMITDVI